jgi:hypothetical protein
VKLSKSGWQENILYNFQLQSDGGVPYGGVVFDKSGNLYGAATEGGNGGQNGGGTVFELTHSNSSWTFTLLYSLSGWGISGTYRNLLLDASQRRHGLRADILGRYLELHIALRF